MKISTKVRYGTRLLVDVAEHQMGAPVALKDVARRQEVSLDYIKHVIGPLVTAGILRTERGNAGGVMLSRPAREIPLSSVVAALQGSTAPVACVDDPFLCRRKDGCATRGVWCRVKEAVDDVLSTTTIQDLVEEVQVAEARGGNPAVALQV